MTLIFKPFVPRWAATSSAGSRSFVLGQDIVRETDRFQSQPDSSSTRSPAMIGAFVKIMFANG
jgi:hypothetical protein